MNYISAENLSRSIADKWLFKEIHFGISKGDKIGLIGINGSGKSTFLKTIAGIDMPESGKVAIAKGVSIGFLGQNPVFDENKTVYENVFSASNPLINLVKAYEKHLESDAMAVDFDTKLHDLTTRMTEENAWNFEQQIKEIISRLNISEYIDRPVRLLSGGQRKRVAMARVLIEEPDLLILDEPTNHLDLDTIEWLEELIHSKFQTLLLVTHDRYFLDRIANNIVELESGNLYKYKGNYSYFLEKKAEREEIQGIEIDKAKNLMRKELDWIRRQPKARGTKAKYRVDAFEDIKATATQKKVDAKLDLQVKTTRQGGKILELKRVSKSFDKLPILHDFTYVFKKGDKIGIIGKNGVGKSTFLNMLIGNIPADKGDINVGETTVYGYYRQEEPNLQEDKRLIEVVKEIAEFIELANGQKISASHFLTMFMFPPAEQYKFVSKLSGGERKRLQLLLVLIKNPNFLILDEPTNDLDIGTLNILEDFLSGFQGTLIIVSHDRYFMDRLVDHLFVFEGEGHIKDFPGNYTEWREDAKEELALKKELANKSDDSKVAKVEVNEVQPKVVAPSKKMSYKEQREFEQIEKEIANLELNKEKLVVELNSGLTDHVKLNDIAMQIQSISDSIDEKTLRWLELSEV